MASTPSLGLFVVPSMYVYASTFLKSIFIMRIYKIHVCINRSVSTNVIALLNISVGVHILRYTQE